MAAPRRFELDELSVRPGTYFNPQTEVLIVVDDSPEVEQAIFDEGGTDDGDWVLVSDETPLDEATRDELLERFQARHRGGEAASAFEDDEEEDEGPDELDADELDEDEEELD